MPYGLDLSRVNHTELVEICRKAGFLYTHRGNKREDLLALLEGTLSEDSLAPDVINVYREAMLHMQEIWPTVFRQLGSCAPEFHACWLCPPARVMYCVVMNCEPDLMKDRGIDIKALTADLTRKVKYRRGKK